MKSAKRGSKRDQTHKSMKHGWSDAHKHSSQCRVTDNYTCAQIREKRDVRSVLFTHSIGCSGLLSAVNDLAKTNFFLKKYEPHQFSFHCHHEVLEEEEDECHLWS